MTRTRACLSLAIASAVAGVAGTLAMPVANADPLDPIRGGANGSRGQTACPPLNYSIPLEGEAQSAAGTTGDGVPRKGDYNGTFIVLKAQGDHEDVQIGRVINDPVSKNAFKDCGYKDYGVGFSRNDAAESDIVTIVLGKPNAPEPVEKPKPVEQPVEQQPTPCPEGSPVKTVPAGQSCPAAEPAPTNAVTMTFKRSGLTNVTATFVNSSKVSGQCHYDAQDVNGILPGKTEDFPIGAKATVTRTYLAPPPLSTYHAVVSCTGDFNGQNVEFGHAEQDVSG